MRLSYGLTESVTNGAIPRRSDQGGLPRSFNFGGWRAVSVHLLELHGVGLIGRKPGRVGVGFE